MSTFGWCRLSQILAAFQSYDGNEVTNSVWLSILYNDVFSEHAKRSKKKERFAFLCYDGNGCSSSHSWTCLQLDNVKHLLPKAALYCVAALCHATTMPRRDHTFRENLLPSGLVGSMYALNPHWDPHSRGQKNRKAADFECAHLLETRGL